MTPALIAIILWSIALYSFHRLLKAADRCVDPVLNAMRSLRDSQFPQSAD